MLWFLVLVLIVLWATGAFFVPVGGLIHLLLVLILVIVIYNLVVGGRRVP